ncbi:uridine kinase family protein [Streptoalloteichus hindustanus]|uniref:(d)CMP kinase n=1 Tax=Streptoalloteichus hindustanus TaxID=2017 RepID=A0A1M4VNY9_STRHI|nr:uridine kinase [Streptoalloteichus hindustanus]SHE70689.1 hypothetical protein SAMN05444320_101838 [Streptoalloteichus hindustanus]
MTGPRRPGPGAADGRPPARDVADAVLAAPARLGAVRLVAIDGPSGSGKSRLADALVAELAGRGRSVELVRTDYFATWDDPVDWWPHLVDGVLTPLRRGERGRYQRVVWHGGEPAPGPFVEVEVPDVLVVEGVSAARAAIVPLLSCSVWVEHPDPAERLERAVRRDGELSRAHLLAWQRFEQGWFATDGARSRADHRVFVTE